MTTVFLIPASLHRTSIQPHLAALHIHTLISILHFSLFLFTGTLMSPTSQLAACLFHISSLGKTVTKVKKKKILAHKATYNTNELQVGDISDFRVL